MQRLFFNFRYLQGWTLDPEGADFLSVEAARTEALITIRKLVSDALRADAPLMLRSIWICDGEARALAEVTVLEALSEKVPALDLRPRLAAVRKG